MTTLSSTNSTEPNTPDSTEASAYTANTKYSANNSPTDCTKLESVSLKNNYTDMDAKKNNANFERS